MKHPGRQGVDKSHAASQTQFCSGPKERTCETIGERQENKQTGKSYLPTAAPLGALKTRRPRVIRGRRPRAGAPPVPPRWQPGRAHFWIRVCFMQPPKPNRKAIWFNAPLKAGLKVLRNVVFLHNRYFWGSGNTQTTCMQRVLWTSKIQHAAVDSIERSTKWTASCAWLGSALWRGVWASDLRQHNVHCTNALVRLTGMSRKAQGS